MNSRGRRLGWSLSIVIGALAGCSTDSGSMTDGEKIVRAALLSAGEQAALCLDSRTDGDPLAVFRTMTMAPIPSRRPLLWHRPSPLNAPSALTPRDLYDDQVLGERVRLRDPAGQGAALPAFDQRRLNMAARALALRLGEEVRLRHSWSDPRATIRWWPLNRLLGCTGRTAVTDMVQHDDIGFVTVTRGHWGTTYAVGRSKQEWRTIGEWTRWLY